MDCITRGQQMSSFLYKSNTDYVKAEVVSIWQPNPEAVKKGNSKWANFMYLVDGKQYISSNRIQVSMNTKVGDLKQIKYDKRNPEKIYGFSVKRACILFIVAIVLFIIAKFKLF
ncbi:hypothetical protein B8V05_03280 [Streptococcus agalactiae]|nr:hypothetical protein B8V03_09530 [Streptococcus agalactiae]QGU78847.1 hypothetical protein BSR14_06315 [Streptococcus salivarius]KAF1130788.1 hypothetical protein B8V05_03280 [Streptococcus agalactiae]KAF1131004.1 hypothetical protein B8V06_05290 [Streptococcus agalactiae]KAF1145767.1 hypothetical protein B8V13_01130 [Streptococcus agalactiae]